MHISISILSLISLFLSALKHLHITEDGKKDGAYLAKLLFAAFKKNFNPEIMKILNDYLKGSLFLRR